MYHPNGPPSFPQNVLYQQSQMTNRQDISRPFLQQQFGPRFQTPSPPQQYILPRPFYQPPQQLHDGTRLPHQGSLQPHSHYQSTNSNFDHNIPKPQFQPPAQNFETLLKPPLQLPVQNFETSTNSQYPPSVGPCFNQPSSPFRAPIQTYESPIQNYNQPSPIQNFNQPPPIQNFNQPPPIQNYNQPPPNQNFNQPPHVQNYNNHPPIHHYNQPPPVQNYNQPLSPPFKSLEPSGNQPMCSPHQSPSSGYGPTPNVQYQPQIHNAELLKQSFNLPGSEFNQRSPLRIQGHQRFPFSNNQRPRYQRPQQDINRAHLQPRQQYQNNYRHRGPFPNINNQPKGNIILKQDKIQIACEMGDCDFVGHASAIKEHQNLHHRLGLHKKVLYSNNSDAVKNWIQERKKKWPTKETIQLKLEVEEEKNKRGERIADEDFQRFNKNSKLNNSGSKRSNNRKRPKFNDKFVEPVEELMNGNLKRFAGIVEVQEKNDIVHETSKLVATKLLVEYDESSDDEPPDEILIVKESASQEKVLAESNKELRSPTSNISVLIEPNEVVNTNTMLPEHDSQVLDDEVKIDSYSNVNCEHEKTNTQQGQKRKKLANKEFKQIKKTPPLWTPRTEIVERKNALVEALMGDLMRSERNTITQCICYIRNNMHRFCKIQAA